MADAPEHGSSFETDIKPLFRDSDRAADWVSSGSRP
jgi:hypothetical protein